MFWVRAWAMKVVVPGSSKVAGCENTTWPPNFLMTSS